MKSLFGASFTIALAAAVLPAAAADLPEVKVSASNPVPQCATPGRLMAYLHARNTKANSRFDGVATEYMRYGEEFGIRWDMAFFQMILETGALSFSGDVRADQNNFAGLGAAGRGKRGERFGDIPTGVKAHLQHLLMYAGDRIDNPVAERTRKVQEWGVLTEWQKSIDGPMTFKLLVEQWAPGSRGYVRDLSTISSDFYDKYCNLPDPQPELVQEARQGREAPATQVATAVPEPTADAAAPPAATPPKVSGAEIARRSIETERKEDRPIAGLGVSGLLKDVAGSARAAAAAQPVPEPPAATADAGPPVTLLNAAKTDQPAPSADKPADRPADAGAKGAPIQTAAITGAATQMKMPAPTTGKCKVWTASYGGQRAILIKAAGKDSVNYTVLDVNEANETREVEAYIAAYAKGGEQIGAFSNQTKALDKAFELCPEG